MRKLAAAAAIVIGTVLAFAGTASAHNLNLSATTDCVDANGVYDVTWTATHPGPADWGTFHGTATVTEHAAIATIVLAPGDSSTATTPQTAPTSTLTLDGSFDKGTADPSDDVPWSDSLTIDQPEDCPPPPTTGATTSTSTSTSTTSSTTPTTTSTSTTPSTTSSSDVTTSPTTSTTAPTTSSPTTEVTTTTPEESTTTVADSPTTTTTVPASTTTVTDSTQPPTTLGALPVTGNDTALIAAVALGFISLGSTLVLVVRRVRS